MFFFLDEHFSKDGYSGSRNALTNHSLAEDYAHPDDHTRKVPK